MRTCPRLLIPTSILSILLATSGAEAASPPPLLNYQGVLRDAQGAPLGGPFDMVFRLFDAASGGSEILVDQHLAAGTGAVQVTGGMFNVELGGGVVSDGAGVFPGDPYTSLNEVFRDFTPAFLQIEIKSGAGFEALAPRILVKSAAYALNATNLNGKGASSFLDTSSTLQTKQGPLAVQGLQTGDGGVTFNGGPSIFGGPDILTMFTGFTNPGYLQLTAGSGADSGALAINGGGAFNLYSTTGEFTFFRSGSGSLQRLAEMLNNNFKVYGTMQTTGAATIGGGMDAAGTLTVHQPGGSQRASLYVQGVDAYLESGPLSSDRLTLAAGSSRITLDGALGVDLKPGDGVVAFYGAGPGPAAASFSASTGTFNVPGTFESLDGTFNFNSGRVGVGPIQALFGGGSTTTPTHALTVGATDSEALRLIGGGLFGSGARLDFGDGHLVFLREDVDDNLLIQASTRTAIMGGNVGIGTTAPATKLDVTGTFHASGTKNFVQNHPSRGDLSVVYTALEGDEAGTYTRGSARLSGGVARIPLGETFALVTNPDVGLTAHLTPRGGPADLYVESITTGELVVRSADRNATSAAFDYIVHGLRIGYEEHAVLQPRTGDAPVPSPAVYDAQYADHTDRRAQDALQRFRRIETEVFGRDPGEMSTSRELRQDIGEFDGDPERAAAARVTSEKAAAAPESIAPDATSRPPSVASTARFEPSPPSGALVRGAALLDPAAAARPTAPVASRLVSPTRVTESVEVGDVLVLDPADPGGARLSRIAGDARVYGVVAEDFLAPADGAAAGDEADARAEVPVALAGVAFCKVDATYGPVRAGDLLTTSPTPGVAMRADAPIAGTILGKALEPLASGSGILRILVLMR